MSDVTGPDSVTAKLTAADEAVDFLQSRCLTIIFKRFQNDLPVGLAVGRDHVLDGGYVDSMPWLRPTFVLYRFFKSL